MKLIGVRFTTEQHDRAVYKTVGGEEWHDSYPPHDQPLREALDDWESELDSEGKRKNLSTDYKPPGPSDVISPDEFRLRFTEDERIAIRAASRSPGGEALDDWMGSLWTATQVGLSDKRTIAAVDLLATMRLITQERRDEILTP